MKSLKHGLLLLILAICSLQVFFIAKMTCMVWLAPQSTTFQRSEMWRLVSKQGDLPWRQAWEDYDAISTHLKRAVIAAEDGDFINHSGIEWDAIEQAWQKNSKAQELAAKRAQKPASANRSKPTKPPKIIGGSTISQQLVKNLFLSGERSFLRKGQEFILTFVLESVLSKQRVLEIYLNSVEWGEGVFGAEAAAQHYFRKSAHELNAYEAARLAVMLPRPKYFEKQAASAYLSNRAATIVARMNDAELP